MPNRWIRAAITYFSAVFAAGFVLGVLRVLAVIPYIGELLAVCLELPLIVAFAWMESGYVLRKFRVTDPARRLALGVLALALLLLTELLLDMLLRGATVEEHLARYRTLPVLLGFGGQLLFAIFPWLRGRRR